MRILQLCKKFPYPPHDGESIAIGHLAKALHQQGCALDLLAMNTSKHHSDLSKLPAGFRQTYDRLETVEVDNRVRAGAALRNLFSHRSYHIERFISGAFAQTLEAMLRAQRYDWVQLETLYLAPYLDLIRRVQPQARIALRAHNIEFEIWERVAAQTRSPLKRWYLRLLTRRLRRFELEQLNRYDALVAITQRDLDFFQHAGCRIPACVAPVGLDLEAYACLEPPLVEARTCGFIGSLDWLPNLEGVDWMLRSVWESVLRRVPDARLRIAGRNCPDWLRERRYPRVEILGEVPDAADFLRRQSLLVVPLLAGGGMRVKILEGMALGKPIVTTALGLEGIEAADGVQVWVADTAETFADRIVEGLLQPEKSAALGQSAALLAQTRYHNRQIAAGLLDFYQKNQA